MLWFSVGPYRKQKMCDQSAKELLDIIVDMLSETERAATMFPRENSAEISVSDFLESLQAKAPAHLQSVVHSAIARFVEVAPRHVFVPYWLRERHS